MKPHRAGTAALRWVPAVAYAALLWWLSARPAPEIPIGLSDKMIHAAAYLILGALVWRACAGRLLGSPSTRAVGLAMAICASYAVIDEVHQGFVPGRVASLADVAADLAGAGAAILILGLAGGRRRGTASDGASGESRSGRSRRLEVSGRDRSRQRSGEQ